MSRNSRSMRKALTSLLCILVLFAMLMPQSSVFAEGDAGGGVTYYDGVYEGSAKGMYEGIEVAVTITNGKIANVELLSNSEPPSYWSKVKDILPARIVENLEGKHIALGSDIDLAEVASWNPIGTEGKYDAGNSKIFSGSFDGKGYSISNLKIHNKEYAEETNLGLFSILDKTAVVRNLKMKGVSIDAAGTDVIRAGSIAGDSVGGSGGTAGAWIDSSSAEGEVKVDTSGAKLAFAGGLIGRMQAWTKVSNSWTDTDVRAFSRGGSNSAYAGGITGNTGNNSLLVNLASFGDAYGCSPKSTGYGGLAGGISTMISGKAWNMYATGSFTAGNGGSSQSLVGAIAAQVTTSGMTGNPNYVCPETGALGYHIYYPQDAALKIEKWNSNATEVAEVTTIEPRATGVVTVNYDKIFETKATAMAREELGSQTFADTLNGNLKGIRGLLDAYGYTDVTINNWETKDGKVLPTGSKWVSKDPDASIFHGGTGTEDDPFRIATEEQLRAFAGSLNEGVDYKGFFVRVTEDIDIRNQDWAPIGGQDYAFDGTFDGNNKTIKGMKAGTSDAPYVMGRDNPYMGLFGVLGKNAVIKDVDLTDVDIYASTPQYAYVGGIAGINDATGETKAAMIVDGCSVQGQITLVADKSNAFVGGIIAQQYRGAVINSWTDIDLKCTVKTGNAIAEVGGLVGLNNRGLVANCYTLGDVYGSASRNNGDEGMASTGNLVGVQAGDLVGSYSIGNNTTAEYSVYAGELTGWITGIGKVYSCYYNNEAVMTIDGRKVVPPADFGTKVAPGVNEEGDAYVGGIVDDLAGFAVSERANMTDKLNSKFSQYPIDISIYGLPNTALKKWKYDQEKNLAVFDEEQAETTYVRPQAEIVPPDVEELRDGDWYGRDPDKKVTVKISVENGEITATDVMKGDAADTEAMEAAVSRARSKSLYGDKTGYGSADANSFGGGKGTKEDPYLINNETQLRALARSVNEDEAFAGMYFRQTADIDVSSEDWLPIGHAVMAKVKKAWTQVGAYPFLGNYDGDSYEITGLSIGSESTPSKDPEMNFTAGLFGFVSGDHYSNEKIPEDTRIVRLENIKLRDVDINITSEGQNYTGGLVGNAQNGFVIDNCSVTGRVNSYSRDSFARGAGIAGNVIRGSVLNCWTDVEVTAETDAGNVYGGGLYAIDNRTTSVNCYSLGSVTGNAAANNKVHIGGLSGQAGGVQYNCYSAGDVTSLKTTSDAGLLAGRIAGIARVDKVYVNSDAKLTVAGSVKEPEAVGVAVPEGLDIVPKTAAEMSSQAFVDLLNKNAEECLDNLAAIQEAIDSQTDLTHKVQFLGTVADLSPWTLEETAVLKDTNLEERTAAEEEAKRKAEEEARAKAEAEAKAKAEAEAKAKAEAEARVREAAAKAKAEAEAKAKAEAEAKAKAEAEAKAKAKEAAEKAKYADKDSITPSDATLANKAKVNKKLNINAGSISTTAKIKKKTMTVKWKKVKGATNYRIAYKEAKAKKWKYKWAKGKTSVTLTKLKNNGLYDFKLQAVKKSGSSWTKSSWSKTNYRFFAGASQKVKAGNKKVTVTVKKVKGASGYQVVYSLKKNMKPNKVKTVKGVKKTKITVNKLKSKKAYYISSRAYKVYKGHKYVGALTGAKKVKIK